MNTAECNAYAKINLSLDITGRREDGYHTVDMVMQSVSLWRSCARDAERYGGGYTQVLEAAHPGATGATRHTRLRSIILTLPVCRSAQIFILKSISRIRRAWAAAVRMQQPC